MQNFLAKKLFKRRYLKTLQDEVWRYEIEAKHTEAMVADLGKLLELVKKQAEDAEKELTQIGENHTREDREKRKGLETTLANHREAVKKIETQSVALRQNAQNSRQRSSVVQEKILFVKENF